MSIANISGTDYQNTVYEYSSKSTAKTTSTSNSFGNILKESAIDDYKMRHPDRARHVDQQVKAGKAFLEKNGLDSSLTENMTMDQYQAYIYSLIDKIPYDYTRQNDTTFVSISDKGWEQMRKDPKYEAWIIGYLVEDRSIRNPFYGWGNNAGNVIAERFGASIDEHIGQSVSKAVFKDDSSNNDDEEEDWWIKRHKRMKKLLKEQVERTMQENAAEKAALQEEYARQQSLHTQRQQSLLSPDIAENQPISEQHLGNHAAAAAASAYIGTLDLFGTAFAPTIEP